MTNPTPRGTLPAFTPVPRKKDRSNGWKPAVQRAFIEALAETGSVAAACRRVGRSTNGAYHLRRQPRAEEFRRAWEAALDCGMQRVEDVAMERALNGVAVPVYSYGKLVGTRTVYNDRLLMFMLRNRAPERFAEGRAKGLNAIGKMELKRLKKQWCKEWEAEHDGASEQAVLDGIDTLIDSMRAEAEAARRQMSPRTRAAWDEYKRLEKEDKEAGYDCYADPEHDLYIDRTRPAGKAAEDDAMALPPPGWREPEEASKEDDGPRIRTVKDEGWE